MSNKDNPNGLVPVGRDPLVEHFYASVTTAVFKGDIVVLNANGRVVPISATTGSVATIGVAAEYSKASNTPAVKIAVYTDPQERFIIQDDGAGATTSNFDVKRVGECAPVVVTTGDTTLGLSKQELDISSIGTGATTDPLKVVGVAGGIDNESGVSHMKWIVMLNRHIKTAHRVGI